MKIEVSQLKHDTMTIADCKAGDVVWISLLGDNEGFPTYEMALCFVSQFVVFVGEYFASTERTTANKWRCCPAKVKLVDY